MGYTRLPVTIDFDALLQAALARIAEKNPGWVPREGHLEVAVLEEMTRLAGETAAVAANAGDRIFELHGARVERVTPIAAAAATATARFTLAAGFADGVNIFPDALVEVRDGADRIYLRPQQTLTIPAGQTVGTVTVVADVPGAAPNGIAAGPARLVTALRAVASVELTTALAGGVDAETAEAYLDRLADRRQLSSARPIRPGDFGRLARDVPGVHRALVLDGYDPDTGATDAPMVTTLAPVDSAGAATAAATDTALLAYFGVGLSDTDRRLINTVVKLIDPTYTAVAVAFTIVAAAGLDPESVRVAAVAAVRGVVSPALFGGGAETPPTWRLTATLTRSSLYRALYLVGGIVDVTSLTIDGAAADKALPGVAPLPAALDVVGGSTVTGTVA